MKTLHFASILVLAAATTLACEDDGDRVEGGNAGSAGEPNVAGSAGRNAAGTSSGNAGAGADAGGSAGADAGGSAGADEGGAAGGGAGGAAGGGGESGEGGAAGGGAGGVGGESGEGGAAGADLVGGAGGQAGAGGEGGVPEVPDVLVPGPTALIGTWNSAFGGTEVITANTWNGINIVAYTSGVRAVYTHNPSSALYFPRKFSKIVYTEPMNDSFYYCSIVYNADTLEAALANAAVPDASDPDNTGCGGFSWTKLTRP